MEPLTILCGNVGWKWDDVWVRRLQAMVARWCSTPYRFICVSDHDIEGVDTRPASSIVLDKIKPQGCWVKLDYFRREISGDGPCIALDLDITIVGDIAALVRDSLHGAKAGVTRRTITPQDVPYMNSSVLSWTPSEQTDVIHTDKIPYIEYPRGDQEFIAAQVPDYQILPDVYSYKLHLTEPKDVLPQDTKVVFFHGHPTPASEKVLMHKWNAESWFGVTPIQRL